jgi:hypothetical protein
METEKSAKRKKISYFDINENLEHEELLTRLRINALFDHQDSVGRGDELVNILKRTIQHLEEAHKRIKNMSTALFIAGLVLLAAAVYQILLGREGQEVWSALLGGLGGVNTLAATFWTTPLKRIAESVVDLVSLETIFLGYIRVIGEADSSFQRQYLDTLSAKDTRKMDEISSGFATQVSTAMNDTIELIEKHLVGKREALQDLKNQLTDLEKRVKKIEEVTPDSQ